MKFPIYDTMNIMPSVVPIGIAKMQELHCKAVFMSHERVIIIIHEGSQVLELKMNEGKHY